MVLGLFSYHDFDLDTLNYFIQYSKCLCNVSACATVTSISIVLVGCLLHQSSRLHTLLRLGTSTPLSSMYSIVWEDDDSCPMMELAHHLV